MIDFFIGVTVVVAAYFLGSIPFGLLLTKYSGAGDIRSIGSGNIGATNVLRTGSKKLAAATLFLDIAKGAVAVLLAKFTGIYMAAIFAAIAAVLGHVFPVWLKFKGGKGVATALAVYWFLYWPLGLFASVSWIVMFYIGRISSLSSIVAMGLAPVIALCFGGSGVFFVSIVVGGVVIYRHKENILRLLRGEEKAFDGKS